MSLFTSTMLQEWIRDLITDIHPGSGSLQCSGGIMLMTSPDMELSPEYLYIGEPDTILEFLKRDPDIRPGTFLISAGLIYPFSDSLPECLTIMETRQALLPLYNRVHEHLHRFRIWDEELHATILLLNSGYKHIAAVYDPDIIDPTADELRENGYQSFDTIQTIHHEPAVKWGENREFAEYISSISGNYTIVRLIHYHGELVARLCVILNGSEPSPYYSDLNELLARFVAEYLFNNQSSDYSGNSQFGALAADLIECRISSEEELQQRLKQIQLATRRYYHAMLIAFPATEQPGPTIPWNYIINQLEYIFPFSNITTYKGEILLIIRKMKRRSRLSFNQEALLKILESYHGYACVGNASEFLMSLPPVYHQCHEALRIGQVMNPQQRIFYYEDYSIYHIIELAAESSRQKLGSRNLVHLCNNELIALVLYDKKHRTNLVEVLQTYLLHERNTSEAAKALFIHRNTMLNKIHKIEEVIDSSLDDPMLRERLLFSCRVIEYMSRYCHEDILVLKRNLEKGKTGPV